MYTVNQSWYLGIEAGVELERLRRLGDQPKRLRCGGNGAVLKLYGSEYAATAVLGVVGEVTRNAELRQRRWSGPCSIRAAMRRLLRPRRAQTPGRGF
jgi:hypothetical protein